MCCFGIEDKGGKKFVLEELIISIAEVIFYVLVCTVFYNTGKMLIFIFTLGKYSSINKRIKIGWIRNSFQITENEENKKCISYECSCNIGFLFWVIFICIILIKYVF